MRTASSHDDGRLLVSSAGTDEVLTNDDYRRVSDHISADPAGTSGSSGVFILDDHEVIRRGMRQLLGSDGVSVVGESGSAGESIRRIPAIHPDLAILDDEVPDGTGAGVCRAVGAVDPDIRCVLLTGDAEEAAMIDAVLAGAWGCLSKQDDGVEQLRLIRRALAGYTAYSSRFHQAPVDKASLIAEAARQGTALAKLSRQEKSTAYGISRGLSNFQISQGMDLSEKTVKNMASSVLMKLGMERRSQAAVLISAILQPWEDTLYGNYRFSPDPYQVTEVGAALRTCTSETTTCRPSEDGRARDADQLVTALDTALSSVLFL